MPLGNEAIFAGGGYKCEWDLVVFTIAKVDIGAARGPSIDVFCPVVDLYLWLGRKSDLYGEEWAWCAKVRLRRSIGRLPLLHC